MSSVAKPREFTALNKGSYYCLVEALHRRTRFFHDPSGGPGLTQQWTGLGSTSDYKRAVADGFMEQATVCPPRTKTWWRLTERGALIVAYWMGCGFTHEEIECEELPPRYIPTCLLGVKR